MQLQQLFGNILLSATFLIAFATARGTVDDAAARCVSMTQLINEIALLTTHPVF
jgi:hypothetical protein